MVSTTRPASTGVDTVSTAEVMVSARNSTSRHLCGPTTAPPQSRPAQRAERRNASLNRRTRLSRLCNGALILRLDFWKGSDGARRTAPVADRPRLLHRVRDLRRGERAVVRVLRLPGV